MQLVPYYTGGEVLCFSMRKLLFTNRNSIFLSLEPLLQMSLRDHVLLHLQSVFPLLLTQINSFFAKCFLELHLMDEMSHYSQLLQYLNSLLLMITLPKTSSEKRPKRNVVVSLCKKQQTRLPMLLNSYVDNELIYLLAMNNLHISHLLCFSQTQQLTPVQFWAGVFYQTSAWSGFIHPRRFSILSHHFSSTSQVFAPTTPSTLS